MKNILFIMLAALALAGCKTSKSLDLEDKTTTATETEKKETVRKGDSLSAFRPVNVKYKDTTIYTYSYETKSFIRETYDEEGNQQIDCITDELREIMETTRTLVENNIKLSEERTSEFNPASLIWTIAGLGFVVLLVAIFGLVAIMSLKKAIPGMITAAIKAQSNN